MSASIHGVGRSKGSLRHIWSLVHTKMDGWVSSHCQWSTKENTQKIFYLCILWPMEKLLEIAAKGGKRILLKIQKTWKDSLKNLVSTWSLLVWSGCPLDPQPHQTAANIQSKMAASFVRTLCTLGAWDAFQSMRLQSGWIGPMPTKGNKQKLAVFFCIFSVHGKIGLKWPQMGPGVFFLY